MHDLAKTRDDALGSLRIRENQLRVETPAQATRLGVDRVRLEARVSVDRAAAGIGWSKMGMIKGKAHLRVNLVLTNSLPQKDQ